MSLIQKEKYQKDQSYICYNTLCFQDHVFILQLGQQLNYCKLPIQVDTTSICKELAAGQTCITFASESLQNAI